MRCASMRPLRAQTYGAVRVTRLSCITPPSTAWQGALPLGVHAVAVTALAVVHAFPGRPLLASGGVRYHPNPYPSARRGELSPSSERSELCPASCALRAVVCATATSWARPLSHVSASAGGRRHCAVGRGQGHVGGTDGSSARRPRACARGPPAWSPARDR
jgi:hypothetical protein